MTQINTSTPKNGTMADVRPAIMELFPDGTQVEGGELLIGGSRARVLADAFGTPAYIVDENALRDRARRYVRGLSKRWPNSRVVFASKAFPSTAIYRIMAEEGLGIDVAGGGELVMALAAGTNPAHIVVHGNAKTDNEIAMAVKAGVGLVVIDNFDDIDRLERHVTDRQAVLLRVRPGVQTETHAAMATGGNGSKFGLGLEETREAVARIMASNRLDLQGLHVHIGSQIMATKPFAEAVESIASLGTFATYDLGGGLGERYTYADEVPTIEEYLDVLVDAAHKYLPADSRLLIEPGRSLVARAGVTLYSVVTVKAGSPSFVAVDGGMGDNLEVSLYGQRFEATVVDRVGGGQPYALVGRHCESGDQLIDRVDLQDPRVGDVIAIPVTGAYCFTMSNNYNGARRLPVVLVRDGAPRLVVRRETYDDLLARDMAWG
jgi:diaminopimelate decarboxylase